MPKRSSTDAEDVNEIAAARITATLIGGHEKEEQDKNPAAVALGRLGGRKGGPARAAASRRASVERSPGRPQPPDGAKERRRNDSSTQALTPPDQARYDVPREILMEVSIESRTAPVPGGPEA